MLLTLWRFCDVTLYDLHLGHNQPPIGASVRPTQERWNHWMVYSLLSHDNISPNSAWLHRQYCSGSSLQSGQYKKNTGLCNSPMQAKWNHLTGQLGPSHISMFPCSSSRHQHYTSLSGTLSSLSAFFFFLPFLVVVVVDGNTKVSSDYMK